MGAPPAGRHPEEHFHNIFRAPAGGDEARSSGSLFHHEDGLQLTAFDEGRCGNHHNCAAAQGKESTAEHSGAELRNGRQVDLHDGGSGSRVNRGDNLGDARVQPAFHAFQRHFDGCTHPRGRQSGFVHGRFQPVDTVLFDGKQRRSRRSQITRLDRLCGDDTRERRCDSGILPHDGGRAKFLFGACQPGVELGAFGSRHFVVGLRSFQPGRRFIEFLVGDGFLRGQVFDAPERGLRQIEIGLGGGHRTLRFGDGALDLGAAGLGAADTFFQLAGVQSDERLPLPNAVSHLHAHLLHVTHHLAGNSADGASPNRARGLVDRRPVSRRDGRDLDRDRRRE
jgi:hypothetical protein